MAVTPTPTGRPDHHPVMTVYFVADRENNHIKIGVSTRLERRLKQLQTANAYPLELMGWIVTENAYKAEAALHQKYRSQHVRGEWFAITQEDVVHELTLTHGFIPKNANAFEIIGRDKDGVPEYLGVWNWDDFEYYECCPYCGCLCGMHFNEALSMYHCISCDELTDFSDIPR